MASLPPEERKKVPLCFHNAAHYTNHLELAMINQLAADAGLDPIHKDVEVLPEDNGERFFSEYLTEQLKRDEDGVTYDNVTKRCMCKACGGRNPYARRRPLKEGAVRVAPSFLKHAPNPDASVAPAVENRQPEKQERTLAPLAPLPPINPTVGLLVQQHNGATTIGFPSCTTSILLWHAVSASYYPATSWAIHTVDKGEIQRLVKL